MQASLRSGDMLPIDTDQPCSAGLIKEGEIIDSTPSLYK